MTTRRFEYRDSTSNKFWEIHYPKNGSTFTTTWGKIGTNGTSQSREFYNKSARDYNMEKTIASKIKKGYKEILPKENIKVSDKTEAPKSVPSYLDIY